MNWLFVKRLRSFVVLAGLSSLVLNVALLMPAIYMMQVFDRVFASGSVETLVMLGAPDAGFLGLGYFLDVVRARALAWAGQSLDRKLAPAAVRSSLEQAAAGPGRLDTDALRDISQLRSFLSGSAVLALFDAPWLPDLSATDHADAPDARTRRPRSARSMLVALGVLTDRLTRAHVEQTLHCSRASTRFAEKLARNAEAIMGMGMTETAVARWGEHHEQLLTSQQQPGACVFVALARHRASAAAGVAGRNARRSAPGWSSTCRRRPAS